MNASDTAELQLQIRHQQRVIDELLDDNAELRQRQPDLLDQAQRMIDKSRASASDAGLRARLHELLPRLIRLCHPDRHDGSRAATETTQALLDLRAEGREQ